LEEEKERSREIHSAHSRAVEKEVAWALEWEKGLVEQKEEVTAGKQELVKATKKA